MLLINENSQNLCAAVHKRYCLIPTCFNLFSKHKTGTFTAATLLNIHRHIAHIIGLLVFRCFAKLFNKVSMVAHTKCLISIHAIRKSIKVKS